MSKLCEDKGGVEDEYLRHRKFIGVGDDGLKVPQDFSLGKQWSILVVHHVEPIYKESASAGKFSRARHIQNCPRLSTTICLAS